MKLSDVQYWLFLRRLKKENERHTKAEKERTDWENSGPTHDIYRTEWHLLQIRRGAYKRRWYGFGYTELTPEKEHRLLKDYVLISKNGENESYELREYHETE